MMRCTCGMPVSSNDESHMSLEGCIEYLAKQLLLFQDSGDLENPVGECGHDAEYRMQLAEGWWCQNCGSIHLKGTSKPTAPNVNEKYAQRLSHKIIRYVRANSEDGREMIPTRALRRMLKVTRRV